MPLASTQSASASDGCCVALLGRDRGERDPGGTGAVLGVAEDDLVERARRGTSSARGAGCPTPRGPARATRGRRGVASLASAGPFTISCHGGIAAVAIDVWKPSIGVNGSLPPPRYQVVEPFLDLAAADAVAERQAADAATARAFQARRDGRVACAR